MKNLFLFIIALIGFNYPSFAQVGIGTETPVASAILEVNSTAQGVLLSRMTSTQRIAIVNPAKGLMVFDTSTNSFWYYDGSFWVNSQAVASYGDIKSGIQSLDHNGWVKLDGRLTSTLSATQRTVLSSLGISTNLPNASDSYLVQKAGTLGSVSGSNTTTLTQSNLPNVTFTGTALDAGSHTHNTDPSGFYSQERDITHMVLEGDLTRIMERMIQEIQKDGKTLLSQLIEHIMANFKLMVMAIIATLLMSLIPPQLVLPIILIP